MDILAVRQALANVANTVDDPSGGTLHGYPYVPNAIVEPAFVVARYKFDPHMTMGGRYQVMFICLLLISAQADEAAQMRQDILMSAGPDSTPTNSLYLALRSQIGEPGERSLGGLVPSAMPVDPIDMNRTFNLGGQRYFGVQIPVRVEGDPIGN